MSTPIDPTGAHQMVRDFTTGGGRAAAAGTDALPAYDRERFTAAFLAAFV